MPTPPPLGTLPTGYGLGTATLITVDQPPSPTNDSSGFQSHDDRHHIHTDFYFDDGNIVLFAPPCVFKVHKGQLARHSEVFENLFSLPYAGDGSANGEESYDGCPVVRMWDDAQDLYYFLKAIYDGFAFAPSGSLSLFQIILPVLKLSTKYIVPHLRQICLAHLQLSWPTDLERWDRREQIATVPAYQFYPPAGEVWVSSPFPPSPILGTPFFAPSSPFSAMGSQGVNQHHDDYVPFTPLGFVDPPPTPPYAQFTPPSIHPAATSNAVPPVPPPTAMYTAGKYLPRDLYPHPAHIILLAHELDIPSLLQAAYYDLSRYAPSRIAPPNSPTSTSSENLDDGAPQKEFDRWISSERVARLKGGGDGGGGGTSAVDDDPMYERMTPWIKPTTAPKLLNSRSALLQQLSLKALRGREQGQIYLKKWIAKNLANRAPSRDCFWNHAASSVDGSGSPGQVPSYGRLNALELGIGGLPGAFAERGSGLAALGTPQRGNHASWDYPSPTGFLAAGTPNLGPYYFPSPMVSSPAPSTSPFLLSPGQAVIPTSNNCSESFRYIHFNVLRSVCGLTQGRDADPLYTLLQAVDMLFRTDFSDGEVVCGLMMCDGCKREFCEEVKWAREEIWNCLPDWFGLEGIAK